MTPQQIVYKSKSWRDFESRISSLPYKERGTAFEWFCKFYLLTNPAYKLTYKKVLHSSEFLKNKTITKRLGLSTIEEGTDLIGETHDGKYEIIQCKFKDNSQQNLTAKDVNSSISVATGKEAKKWVDSILMCSNLKGFTSNKRLQEQHNLQFRTLLLGNFEALTQEDFKNIRKAIQNEIPTYKPKKPRKHQRKAVKALLSHFDNNTKGQIIHACGTGKTLTSYFVYKELNPKLTLFVVPNLQLINQTLLEWSKESIANELPISPLVVCSDPSNEKISEHDPYLWLQELPVKVSTSDEDINQFLSSSRKNKVIFSTYQSGIVLARQLKKQNKKIDFAFFDEAHNTATAKSKLFGHLLDDNNLIIKKRLFMTATPKKLVGKNDRFLSMDDEEVFGKVVDEITVKDAIEVFKLLNDYKIITQLIDNVSSEKLLRDNPFVIDNKEKYPEEVELKLVSSALTLQEIIRKKKIKNTVSFHSKIERAKAFKEGINNIFTNKPINTYHVSGKQSGTERQGILKDFAANPPSLVTNSQCLSEGVNVPSIDAIMFVDPKQSKIDITQAIGRALRKGDSTKGLSYIIVPIVINKNSEESIDEAYQQILMVLRAMSEHDGRIVESFKYLADGKKPPKNFMEINTEYLPEEFDLKQFSEELHTKAWDRFSKLGRRPFAQAREWARTLGINSVEWREFCKTDKKPLDIPADVSRAYGSEWTDWRDFLGQPSEEEDFNQLIFEYKENAKNKLIPFPKDAMITESGYKLGNKVRGLINSYNEKTLPNWKKRLVQKELISKNIFDWDGRHAFSWKLYFKAYKNFKEKSGDSLPKRNELIDGLNLRNWLSTQRVKYRNMNQSEGNQIKKPLEEWQLKLLKEINFDFSDRQNEEDNKWKFIKKDIEKLLKKHKGIIPYKHPTTGKQIKAHSVGANRWIVKQRNRKKNNSLEQWKINELEKIPHWTWDPFEDAFESNLKALIAYIKETNNPNPAQGVVFDDVAIGMFLTRLRTGSYKTLLTNKIKKQLEDLGTNFKPTKKIGSAIYYN
ncbi:DEAD/DEAH box helicase family protein [SAR86 cluster bacterium]|nr:DEAD/DEAH box helicase family protein [SAR86 cluster bacterium]